MKILTTQYLWCRGNICEFVVKNKWEKLLEKRSNRILTESE